MNRHLVFSLPTLVLSGMLLAGCQGTPTLQTGADAEVVDGNLHRVNHSSLDKVYVNPASDFSKYHAVLVEPLNLDNVDIVQPTASNRLPGNPKWKLTDKDQQDMRAAYRKAIEEALTEKGRFTLSTEPGEAVLTIQASVTRLAPTAPKDDFKSRPIGRSHIVSEGAGDATIAFEFLDTESGKVVARAEDKWSGNSIWRVNNSVTNRAEVLRMFRSWAARVGKELEGNFSAS